MVRRLIDLLRELGCGGGVTPPWNPESVTYSGETVTWSGEGVTYNA